MPTRCPILLKARRKFRLATSKETVSREKEREQTRKIKGISLEKERKVNVEIDKTFQLRKCSLLDFISIDPTSSRLKLPKYRKRIIDSLEIFLSSFTRFSGSTGVAPNIVQPCKILCDVAALASAREIFYYAVMCVFKLVFSKTKVVASIFEWNLLRDIFDHVSHEIAMLRFREAISNWIFTCQKLGME